jgi:hypothetical protein
MLRHVFTAVRLLLVLGAVAIVALVVNWRTVLVVPAGEPGLAGAVADVPTTHFLTSVEAAGPGALWVRTESGLEGQVEASMVKPGMLNVIGEADGWWLLLGLGLVGCIYPLQATRWWLLMRCRGLPARWLHTLRLVLVGAFCNFLLPGTEGGDVVKAWAASKGTDRRVEAVMSVVFDRITGLLGLVILAAVAGVFLAKSGEAQQVGAWVVWAMAGVGVMAIVAFFAATRGWLRLPEMVRTFGGGLPARMMRAARAYSQHPGPVLAAVFVSAGVQILLASAAGCAAWSLGINHDLIVILAVMPILFLAAAVPLTWQGVGVMEMLGVALLVVPGVAAVNQIVGLLVLYRAFELVWGGVGSLLMLGAGISMHPERTRQAA